MKKNIIVTKKIARYFTSGNGSKSVKTIWFLIHGYGQLASDFIKEFEPLLIDTETLIVAPEGLHRFYIKGFHGKVGASWMTKEDRECDILDYNNYLNSVYSEVTKDLDLTSIQINVLGFSQGTATACRWILENKVRADKLILWGGGVPNDTDFDKAGSVLSKLNLTIVYGNKDNLITREQMEKHLGLLDVKNIKYNLFSFEGGHEIYLPALFKALE